MNLKVLSIMLCVFVCISFQGSILVSLNSTKYPEVSHQPTILSQTETIKSTIDTTTAKSVLSSSQYFTENKGQWNPEILYIGNTSFGRVSFTTSGIYYEIKQEQSEKYISLSFVEPNIPTIKGSDLLLHHNNYMLGNLEKWAIGCKNYATIVYTNIWTGIDLSYSFTAEGLKYKYYLHPEANIDDLKVKVTGATLKEENTALILDSIKGHTFTLIDDELCTFTKDSKQELTSSFVINGNNIYSFNIESLLEARNETIVIDPCVYSTYIGGSDDDYGYSIAVDDQNCAYIAGSTHSKDFPVNKTVDGEKAPGYEQTYNGNIDAFVVKLNQEGTQIVYSTFIGGNDDDHGYSIAVDDQNCAYIAGSTHSKDFTVNKTVDGAKTPGYDKTYNGGFCDAFVVKLNQEGTQIVYSTYIGGNGYDSASSIALSSDYCVYLAGGTQSNNFPVNKTVEGEKAPGYDQICNDKFMNAFVVKLNQEGTQIVYSTYIGGSDFDYGDSIAVDDQDCAYVTGSTRSKDFPVNKTVEGEKAPGYDQTYNGNIDAFVVKLNQEGTQIVYSTFIGGNDDDHGYSIAVDDQDCAYVTGSTRSKDFPMNKTVDGEKAPGYDQTYNGNKDAFVVKLNQEGTQIQYAIFLGGEEDDVGILLTLDKNQFIYVIGSTCSKDFPMNKTVDGEKAPGYDQTYNGNKDAFVVKLNQEGTQIVYSTFIGGNDDDHGYSIAVDDQNCAYIAGYTNSKDFPMNKTVDGEKAPGYDQIYNGNKDAFVVKLKLKTTKPVELIITLQIGNVNAKKESTDGSINETVMLDAPPIIINSRTLVPLRFLAESFGATLGWDGKEEKIQIKYDDMLIHLWLHRKHGRTYDALIERAGETPEEISLTTLPFIINGRTMVPLRFISEIFGATLEWNGETKIIKLKIEMKEGNMRKKKSSIRDEKENLLVASKEL